MNIHTNEKAVEIAQHKTDIINAVCEDLGLAPEYDIIVRPSALGSDINCIVCSGGAVFWVDDRGRVGLFKPFIERCYAACRRAYGQVNKLPIEQRSKHYSKITAKRNKLRRFLK